MIHSPFSYSFSSLFVLFVIINTFIWDRKSSNEKSKHPNQFARFMLVQTTLSFLSSSTIQFDSFSFKSYYTCVLNSSSYLPQTRQTWSEFIEAIEFLSFSTWGHLLAVYVPNLLLCATRKVFGSVFSQRVLLPHALSTINK